MKEIAKEYRLPAGLKGTILESIMRSKVRELDDARAKVPGAALESALERAPEIRSFKKALAARNPAIIAEIKRASPSAGVIRKDFDPLSIAREYRDAGAAALSVLTEVQHFQGGLETLSMLRWNTLTPLLRKDFLVDRYQVLEARLAGADAILLIAALLDDAALKMLRLEAERLGMDALIEVHDEAELERALESGATLVGVNNRDLRTFEVSLEVSLKLASKLPKQVFAVSESGIRTSDDILKLLDAGYRGFLVGERLMRAASPGAALAELLRGLRSAS